MQHVEQHDRNKFKKKYIHLDRIIEKNTLLLLLLLLVGVIVPPTSIPLSLFSIWYGYHFYQRAYCGYIAGEYRNIFEKGRAKARSGKSMVFFLTLDCLFTALLIIAPVFLYINQS